MTYINISKKSAVIMVLLFTCFPYIIIFFTTCFILPQSITDNPYYYIAILLISLVITIMWLLRQRVGFDSEYLYIPTKPLGLRVKKIKISDIQVICEKIMDIGSFPAYVVAIKNNQRTYYFRANYFTDADRVLLYINLREINNKITIKDEFL